MCHGGGVPVSGWVNNPASEICLNMKREQQMLIWNANPRRGTFTAGQFVLLFIASLIDFIGNYHYNHLQGSKVKLLMPTSSLCPIITLKCYHRKYILLMGNAAD